MKTTVRVNGKVIPFTPRMRNGLLLLVNGDDLGYATTPIGRPTKQRLAKYGLAQYRHPKDWDGPMIITSEGLRVWNAVKPRGDR